jgi:hypothetical protein
MKIVGLAAAALVAVLLAACSSSSTGAETLYGSTTSTANNPTIPLKATGVFTDTGSIVLGSKTTKGTLHFTKGALNVTHSNPPNPNAPTSSNATTCRVLFAESGTFKITGGTGTYKGATGHGTFKVTFGATFPKLASGKCNESNSANPVAGTSLTTFKATGNVTIQ